MPLRQVEDNSLITPRKEHTMLPTTPEEEEYKFTPQDKDDITNDDITHTTQDEDDILLAKDDFASKPQEKDEILPTMQLLKSMEITPGTKTCCLQFKPVHISSMVPFVAMPLKGHFVVFSQ